MFLEALLEFGGNARVVTFISYALDNVYEVHVVILPDALLRIKLRRALLRLYQNTECTVRALRSFRRKRRSGDEGN